MKKSLLAFVCVFFLLGCVFYPKQVTYVDEKCDRVAKKFVLQDNPAAFDEVFCHTDECVLLGLGVMGVGFVVSGSVVLIGNTVYWLENKYKCNGDGADND